MWSNLATVDYLQTSSRCNLQRLPSAVPLPSAISGNGNKMQLLPSRGGMQHRRGAQPPPPLPRAADTVPTLTPSPPSSASWEPSMDLMTSPVSLFFPNTSAPTPPPSESPDSPSRRAVPHPWEQSPDLVTAESCMENFVDLGQYCAARGSSEPLDDELNTPVIELSKEPSFDLSSQTTHSGDPVSFSWGYVEPYDVIVQEPEKSFEETNSINKNIVVQNTKNMYSDNYNNNTVTSNRSDGGNWSPSPVMYPTTTSTTEDGRIVIIPYTEAPENLLMVVDREVEVEDTQIKEEVSEVPGSRSLKPEMGPTLSSFSGTFSAQIAPSTNPADVFQSVPQDFDLMKFLLEDGMPESVPDLLMPANSDCRVPNSNRSKEQEPVAIKVERPQTAQPGGKDDGGGEQSNKLQMIIRKNQYSEIGNRNKKPSYSVVHERPQRAASKRGLEAIKQELLDAEEDEYDILEQEPGRGRKRSARSGRPESSRRRRRTRTSSEEHSEAGFDYPDSGNLSRNSSEERSHPQPACRRYRELRDKNNEASRRSRENRKQREVEMQEQCERLTRENTKLRVRAEELERLVDSLRKALVAAVSRSTRRADGD